MHESFLSKIALPDGVTAAMNLELCCCVMICSSASSGVGSKRFGDLSAVRGCTGSMLADIVAEDINIAVRYQKILSSNSGCLECIASSSI